jgi:hypothetical protein
VRQADVGRRPHLPIPSPRLTRDQRAVCQPVRSDRVRFNASYRPGSVPSGKTRFVTHYQVLPIRCRTRA